VALPSSTASASKQPRRSVETPRRPQHTDYEQLMAVVAPDATSTRMRTYPDRVSYLRKVFKMVTGVGVAFLRKHVMAATLSCRMRYEPWK